MKRLIKTGITILIAAGMLTMSLPAFVLADETVNTAEFDPNMLLSEDELPEGAEIIEAPDEGEVYVYIYDENGMLVPVDPVFEDEDEDHWNLEENDPKEKPYTDPIIAPEDSSGEEPEPEDETTEAYGPLTPEGNLTLIDDYGSPSGAGKQFITVQTKSGAYYYLIIDRDDNGNETVHFLNQVDDADILAHMEDEEVEAYKERLAELEAKKTALATEESAGREQPQATEPIGSPSKEGGETAKKPLKLDNSSLLIVGAVAIFGIIALIYIKVVKKKKPAANSSYDQEPDEWDDEGPAEVADVPDKQEDTDDE